MKAYALGLRERIVTASAQPGRTVPALAAQFSVLVSFVEKLLHRQRTTGSVAALPPRPGPAPELNAAARDELPAYLRQVLSPTLQSGDVVVLGNLPAHKVAGLAQLVEARGARLLYLPLYSPDFNPIESAFS